MIERCVFIWKGNREGWAGHTETLNWKLKKTEWKRDWLNWQKKKKLKDFVTEPLSCRKERKQDFCGHCWPFLSLALSYGYLKCYMKFKAVSFKCHMHNDKKSNKKKNKKKCLKIIIFLLSFCHSVYLRPSVRCGLAQRVACNSHKERSHWQWIQSDLGSIIFNWRVRLWSVGYSAWDGTVQDMISHKSVIVLLEVCIAKFMYGSEDVIKCHFFSL